LLKEQIDRVEALAKSPNNHPLSRLLAGLQSASARTRVWRAPRPELV
jgi:hypothetical protein